MHRRSVDLRESSPQNGEIVARFGGNDWLQSLDIDKMEF
jgi:hypothetical protein